METWTTTPAVQFLVVTNFDPNPYHKTVPEWPLPPARVVPDMESTASVKPKIARGGPPKGCIGDQEKEKKHTRHVPDSHFQLQVCVWTI